jgi:hypothetical protein
MEYDRLFYSVSGQYRFYQEYVRQYGRDIEGYRPTESRMEIPKNLPDLRHNPHRVIP